MRKPASVAKGLDQPPAGSRPSASAETASWKDPVAAADVRFTSLAAKGAGAALEEFGATDVHVMARGAATSIGIEPRSSVACRPEARRNVAARLRLAVSGRNARLHLGLHRRCERCEAGRCVRERLASRRKSRRRGRSSLSRCRYCRRNSGAQVSFSGPVIGGVGAAPRLHTSTR